MRCPTLDDLPPRPAGKTGWLWTEARVPETMPDGKPMPRISIVTPSFNQGQFLEETVRSVLLQGYPNLEYIVIDGGSTDNSVEIIRKYERWLTHWISEPDRGQASAINKGFRQSTGQVMAWLNSDDCLQPGAIRQVVSVFNRSPQTNVVCGYRQVVDANSRHVRYEAYLKPDKFSLSRICYIPQETVYWRRTVWQTVGELDESYQFALDFDYWQRVLLAGYRFDLMPRFISLFRLHANAKGERSLGVRVRELARIHLRYLSSAKTELELRDELSPGWWRRMRFLRLLAGLRLARAPRFADVVVNALSLTEHDVANIALTHPR